MRIVIVAAALAFAAAAAFAQSSEEVARPDPAVEARLRGLGEELRCLVCQNQTLADSSAPLAQDLRNEIRQLIAQGRSDDEIREYLVQRYGDFVLYRPPWKATTLALWLGPFLLLALGAGVFARIVRGRRAAAAETKTPAEDRGRVEALLANDD
ncbi:MAG TPA: cytochrome c-type biogenesis protein [Usitatibacter sp.]|nr:cytochrome c-type biogenesis protein [Usitatibacter sp.]